jgi:tripartite-type tricarboxylate transporter receptor subunit TctC
VLAPRGIPLAILVTLDKHTAAIVNAKDFGDAVNTQGIEADHIGLEAFGAFIREDHARWKQLIEKNRISG